MVKMVKNGGPDLKRAWHTGLSARRAGRTNSRGPKGLQLEVGPRRGPWTSGVIYFENGKGKLLSEIRGVGHLRGQIASCWHSLPRLFLSRIQFQLKFQFENMPGFCTVTPTLSRFQFQLKFQLQLFLKILKKSFCLKYVVGHLRGQIASCWHSLPRPFLPPSPKFSHQRITFWTPDSTDLLAWGELNSHQPMLGKTHISTSTTPLCSTPTFIKIHGFDKASG